VTAPERRVDVLLVEDNADDAALTMRALSRLEPAPAVVHVEDGARALDFLFGGGAFAGRDTAIQPRLVLTDLQMPRMDGVELLKSLRADPRTRAIPVVVLSSSGEERDVAACIGHGANSYVLKPVDFDAFNKVIEHLCRYWLDVNVVPGQH
jgi:two-component system response regulator